MESLSERFQKLHSSVFAGMYDLFAAELGVDPKAIEQLGVGYDYRSQAWVFAERNALGDIIGLSYRYENGKKTMAPGIKQKRGLVYPFNQEYDHGTKRYAPGRHNWTRIADAGVVCPVCGKPDGCLVSSDDPSDPSAAICIRPQAKEGAAADLGSAGYLHILKKEGHCKTRSVLPDTGLPILVVEGASDVLAAMSLGYVAVGRPGASAGLELLTQMPLAGREVWIIGENDAGAGKEGMEKTFAVVCSMTPDVKQIMPPEGIKDLRVWYNAGLNAEMLTEWVKDHGESPLAQNPDIFENGQATTLARAFLDVMYRHNDQYTLRNYRQDWYTWNQGRYERLSENVVRGQLYEYFDGKSYMKETANGKVVQAIPMTRKVVSDVIDTLNMPSLCPIGKHAPVWMSRKDRPDPRDLIVFKNGLLDVNKYVEGEIVLYDPDPDLFVMNTFPYEFDENASSPMIEDYFKEIFEDEQEVIRLLRQWIGYNLVPDMTQEKMMLFTGRPRSGKSTTLDILRATLGQDQCCSLQMCHLVNRFGRAPMLGKLAATFGDVKTPRASEAGVALETLLAIIGQDAVSIDRKNIEELTNVKLFCRFTMVMNDLPAFSDYARALVPRTSIIYYPRSYVGREDRGLKLRLEAEARNGKLITWALEGLKDLRTHKRFVEPTASAAMMKRFELATMPIMLFAEECCKRQQGTRVLRKELYDAYRAWCKEQGTHYGMNEQFSRWLLNACPDVNQTRHRLPSASVKDPDRPYFFEGITLTERARKAYLT
jgi:P4 family phage/plasmid primase-like protien